MKSLRLLLIPFTLFATDYKSTISPINAEIKIRMIQGDSWRKGCPVGLSELRYLRMRHWDFKGKTRMGELIVHQEIASNITKIFELLYANKYPIRQMRLVSDFKGNDWQSIEADNTSAFNCRPVTGNKKKWSKHAYAKAIDLNPLENPYISKSGYISHKASYAYKKRVKNSSSKVSYKAMLLPSSPATRIFKKYGWKWGGEWKRIKDYQHFSF